MFNCTHLYLCTGGQYILRHLGTFVLLGFLNLCQSFAGVLWFVMCKVDSSWSSGGFPGLAGGCVAAGGRREVCASFRWSLSFFRVIFSI